MSNYGNQPAQQTEPMAIVSMILGIFSLVSCLFPMAIVAVILGHMSKSKIRQDPSYTGDGMATTGLVMGYITIGLTLIIVIFYIIFFVVLFGAAAAG